MYSPFQQTQKLFLFVSGPQMSDQDTPVNVEASSALFEACRLISQGVDAQRAQGLTALQASIAAGGRADIKDPAGLRAVDVVVRGADSSEAAFAVELLAEAGFAEAMMAAPTSSEMPPMMAACHAGNPLIVEKFLEIGMPGDVKANAPKIALLGGTPFHATVLGYRESRKDDYAAVLRALVEYCPDGIDIPDRLRRKPIELALKAAAATQDRTLADAMLQFGVDIHSKSGTGADKIVDAMMRRSGDETLRVLVTGNEARAAVREIEGLVRPRP